VFDALIYLVVFAAVSVVGFALMYRYAATAIQGEKQRSAALDESVKTLNKQLNDAQAEVGRVKAIEEERDRLISTTTALQTDLDETKGLLATEREARKGQEEAIERREEQLIADEARIRDAIKVLAKDVVDQNSEAFLKQAEAKLQLHQKTFEGTLLPLKESLKRVDEQAQSLESARQKAFGEIAKGLENVVASSQSVAREAGGLKDALKKPHVRGRWGEAQLQNCMELAGMSEHCDITFQDSFEGEDGRLIPDMTVKMPGGRLIVVDAKTPREAFDEYIEAPDEDTRKAALLRHGRQVLSHVESLAKKDYGVRKDHSPDFVVMFLPNESFLYAALEGQPNLVEAALAKRILIASPPTLVGLLKVIRYGWTETRLADDAQKIAKEGAILHKRISEVFANFANLGKNLDNAKSAFDTAQYNLNSRVLVSARRLEALGASSGKTVDALQLAAVHLPTGNDELPELMPDNDPDVGLFSSDPV
jgi:DNA recombination protein RmuC